MNTDKKVEKGTNRVEYFTEPFIKKLTSIEAKFILDHAEKQLKETLDTNLLIVSRTTTLLTITVGFMVALVGFGLNRWEKLQVVDDLFLTATIGVVYLFFLAILLCKNIQPRKYITLGARPKSFFDKKLFEIDSELRLIYIYANEIESYQTRIAINHSVNETRWRLFDKCLKCVVATPIVFIASYVLLKAIPTLFFQY